MKQFQLILSSSLAFLLIILLFSINYQSGHAQEGERGMIPDTAPLVISNTLPVGDDLIHGMIFHNGYLWASTRTAPARILKINPNTLEVADSIVLPAGLDYADDLTSAGGYLWVILYTSPAKLIRITPETMEWSTAVTFENSPGSPTLNNGASIEYAFDSLWIGGSERIARVNITDLSYEIYNFSNLNLFDTGVFVALVSDSISNHLWGSYLQYSNTAGFQSATIIKMDHNNPKNVNSTTTISGLFPDDMVHIGGYLYASSENSPAQTSPSDIYKFPSDPASFVITNAANSASYGLFNSSLEPQYFWGAYVGSPGIIKKFDQDANPVLSITLPAGFNDPSEIAFDGDGSIYVTTWQAPAKIVKYTPQYFTFPADLSIGMLGQPAEVMSGDILTYTISVVNNGPLDASEVKVVDILPLGVDFVSSLPGSIDCNNQANQISCDIGNLEAGKSAQITISVIVDHPGSTPIHNTASVSAISFDPDLANNSASVDTIYVPDDPTINNSADLSIGMLAEPSEVSPGDILTYTILVTNNGPANASDVKLIDTLPVGVVYASVLPDSTGCAHQGSKVSCSLGTLQSGKTIQFKILVNVTNLGNQTNIHNTASVSAVNFDPDPVNNSASIDTIYVPGDPSTILKVYMPIIHGR